MSNTLQPPMQNDPGIHIFDPTNKRAVPFFRFGTIGLAPLVESEDNDGKNPLILISTAVPKVEGRIVPHEAVEEGDDVELENVIQTYTVHVPYSVEVDGYTETRTRSETRTRTVPIKRLKPTANPETGKPPVQQAFTISVPYTEQIQLEDGTTMSVTRSRLETRTRWVHPNELPVKFLPKVLETTRDLGMIQCFSKSGKPLTNDELLKKLTSSRPALLVNDSAHIAPYFAQLLSDNAIIVEDSWLQIE